MSRRAFVCAQCRTWFEGEGGSPSCPACGKPASSRDALGAGSGGSPTKESRNSRPAVERQRPAAATVFSAIAALLALVGVVGALLTSEEGGGGSGEIDLGSFLTPATQTPMDNKAVLAAFANAHSIPLTYVNDARPVARYEAQELQVGDGGFVRLRMTVINRGEAQLSLGPSYSYGILSDGRGFNFSVYHGVTLTNPDEGLPDSLQPGKTWSGWVYLISHPPGVVFFIEGGKEFILELSSEPGRTRFRHFIPLR